MEVNGLGAAQLENFRLSAASAGLSGAVNHSPEHFADILAKSAPAARSETDDGIERGTPVISNKKITVDKNDQLYKLCLELETFLVKNLITSMRSTVQKSGLVDEGFAGKMYEDMLYDEYAKNMAKSANFGLAEQAYVQLKRYEA